MLAEKLSEKLSEVLNWETKEKKSQKTVNRPTDCGQETPSQ